MLPLAYCAVTMSPSETMSSLVLNVLGGNAAVYILK